MNGHTPPAVFPELQNLPDPWLFDSEALLRELDRCRETVLQIPQSNTNAMHFGIQLAFRKRHDADLQQALSQPHTKDPDTQPRPANGHKTPFDRARRANARR